MLILLYLLTICGKISEGTESFIQIMPIKSESYLILIKNMIP